MSMPDTATSPTVSPETGEGSVAPPQPEEGRLTKIAASLGDLPVLPHVAVKALQLADDEDWDLNDLKEEILRDHTLVARFLRLSNSAYYGSRRQITTLDRALQMLGIRKIRTVLWAASVEELHAGKRSNFSGKVLWQHALATAFASQYLADKCSSCDKDEAFMAGLLHDIGRPIMDHHCLDQYARVIELRDGGSTGTLREAEQQVFGFDHTDVGLIIARAWDLPAVITDTIRFHHDPESAQGDPRQTATVSLANSLCAKYQMGVESHPDLELEELTSVKMLEIEPRTLEQLMEQFLYIVRPVWTI